MRLTRAAVGAGLAVAALVLWPLHAALAQQHADVPYVSTPQRVVEAMLEAGQVSASDFLIDLGSGDGRVVIEAVRQRGARGMGIELDPNLVSTANREASRLGIAASANFLSGNLFNFDFSKATVVTMYLLPKVNLELRPRILSQMAPGTRIVSHDFDMGKWKPDARREVAVPNKSYGPPVSQVYLWVVPANASGKWQWRLPAGTAAGMVEATVRQSFQELNIDAVLDGHSAAVQGAQLRGDTISFTLILESGGQKLAQEFSGRIAGDRITGNVRTAGSDKFNSWQATRFARGEMKTE